MAISRWIMRNGIPSSVFFHSTYRRMEKSTFPQEKALRTSNARPYKAYHVPTSVIANQSADWCGNPPNRTVIARRFEEPTWQSPGNICAKKFPHPSFSIRPTVEWKNPPSPRRRLCGRFANRPYAVSLVLQLVAMVAVFGKNALAFSGGYDKIYMVEDGYCAYFTLPKSPNFRGNSPTIKLCYGGNLHNGKKSSICRDCVA